MSREKGELYGGFSSEFADALEAEVKAEKAKAAAATVIQKHAPGGRVRAEVKPEKAKAATAKKARAIIHEIDKGVRGLQTKEAEGPSMSQMEMIEQVAQLAQPLLAKLDEGELRSLMDWFAEQPNSDDFLNSQIHALAVTLDAQRYLDAAEKQPAAGETDEKSKKTEEDLENDSKAANTSDAVAAGEPDQPKGAGPVMQRAKLDKISPQTTAREAPTPRRSSSEK